MLKNIIHPKIVKPFQSLRIVGWRCPELSRSSQQACAGSFSQLSQTTVLWLTASTCCIHPVWHLKQILHLLHVCGAVSHSVVQLSLSFLPKLQTMTANHWLHDISKMKFFWITVKILWLHDVMTGWLLKSQKIKNESLEKLLLLHHNRFTTDNLF